MSRRLRAEVALDIRRPLGEVFTALCEARAWPAWARWATEVRADPPGPIRGGTQLEIVRRGLSLRPVRRWHVTDLRPDRLIALEDESGTHRFWLHLEPGREATTVIHRVQLPSAGLLPFLRRRSEERALRADLRRLRTILESPEGVATLLAGRPSAPGPDVPPVTSLEGMRRSR